MLFWHSCAHLLPHLTKDLVTWYLRQTTFNHLLVFICKMFINLFFKIMACNGSCCKDLHHIISKKATCIKYLKPLRLFWCICLFNFHPMIDCVAWYLSQTTVVSFMHILVFICKIFIKLFFKGRFVMLIVAQSYIISKKNHVMSI